jgi:hypothetical protein
MMENCDENKKISNNVNEKLENRTKKKIGCSKLNKSKDNFILNPNSKSDDFKINLIEYNLNDFNKNTKKYLKDYNEIQDA